MTRPAGSESTALRNLLLNGAAASLYFAARTMQAPILGEIQAMSWRDRLALVWVTTALTACGCLTKASTLSSLPPIPAPPPSAPATGQVTRSQKPDAVKPPSPAVCRLISMPVDRPAEVAHGNPTASIRAVVNGELILEEELRIACMQDMMAARSTKEREAVLRQGLETLIEREILLQDAIGKLQRGGKQGEAFLKKIREVATEEFDKRWLRPMLKAKHLDSRTQLATAMEQSGLSLEVMRRWWERNFMASEYLRSRVEPQITRIGHEDILNYYDNHRDEYTQPDSVDWQDIFLDVTRHASRDAARRFAESLVQRVRQGDDFAKLSHEFDNGESGQFRKGAGQGHKHGEIFPHEAEEKLFQMHEGDIEIVECSRGFHIVHLQKRQQAGPIPFDAKVQKEIRDKLRMTVYLREKESIVRDLKRKAVIDRCDRPN
jgi:parvulin-like peptidyl-prolyl isomerase